LLLHAGLIGSGHSGVQRNQYLAGFHPVTIFHHDGLDYTGLQRLDDLGAVGDDDAPRGNRHDVHLAEDGPEQGDPKQRHDAVRKAPRRGVHGGFLQSKCCGQEGNFVCKARRAGQLCAVGPGGLEDGAVAGANVGA
jgi:hypothetical protein